MSKFTEFSQQVEIQFNKMSKEQLYIVSISKDKVWETYLEAFEVGTNPIYKERTEHDCQHCRQFIKAIGNVVSIKDGELVSIWDVNANGIYNPVAKALSELIKSADIEDVFIHYEHKVSKHSNIQILDELDSNGEHKEVKWNHFACTIPSKYVAPDGPTKKSVIRGRVTSYKRALEEITPDSLDTVIDLVEADNLYKGTEFIAGVRSFKALQAKFTGNSTYYWDTVFEPGTGIRNSVIGTLLLDLSKGTDVETAVKSYESKTAPSNYKRSSSIITKRMTDEAIKTINELGIEESLHRRYAKSTDVSINDVIFADKSTSMADKGSLASILGSSTISKVGANSTVISIDTFIDTVVPKASTIEAMLDNKHISNLCSVVAPINSESPNILKWDNNFTWSYNGEVTDSMKEKVKRAGGNAEGFLRFTILWNEDREDSHNDLDAHCDCPTNHIYYGNKLDRLDVDIIAPGDKDAVENITWDTKSTLKDGTYKFYVNNFSGRNTKGFRAELEIDGVVHSYDYPKSVTKDVTVAVVIIANGNITIDHKLPSSEVSSTKWNVQTKQYHKVSMMMLSPNYWSNQEIGNKHYMFMLDGCINPDKTRGLYNEFLSDNLHKHRKVLEVLGSKLKCEESDEQISGIAFSSTVRNELAVKVDGRPYTIKF